MRDPRHILLGFKTKDGKIFIGLVPKDRLVARRHPEDEDVQKRYISFFIRDEFKQKYFIGGFVGFDLVDGDNEPEDKREAYLELKRRIYEIDEKHPGFWNANIAIREN